MARIRFRVITGLSNQDDHASIPGLKVHLHGDYPEVGIAAGDRAVGIVQLTRQHVIRDQVGLASGRSCSSYGQSAPCLYSSSF